MHWFANAPANIALIKYMGKQDEQKNHPANPSLSYTLNELLSTVRLEKITAKEDRYEALNLLGAAGEFVLSAEGKQKFINHLARIKAYFAYEGSFLVQSSNNFPHSSGLASSASSFAALTRCASFALSELTRTALPSVDEQAYLSRLGSGSSCRSFYSPWALWDGAEVKFVDLPYPQLLHQVVLISRQQKKVSSSEAHQRVKTSPFYAARIQRAEKHLKSLLNALMTKNWAEAYCICWDEFQDMHRLFHTCAQPFSYINEHSLALLQVLEELWNKQGDGPIVTMDAGPNIHLLYRVDQQEMLAEFKRDYLLGHYDVL